LGYIIEFEENVYKKGLLIKGKDTIQLIQDYKNVYDALLKFQDSKLDNEFKNLTTIMQIGLPSDEWVPPLMYFYKKFGRSQLVSFIKKLEFKFASDWILQFTSTQRIENINKILKAIKNNDSPDNLLSADELFEVDKNQLRNVLNGDIYGRRFARYILLKYEFLESDNTVHLADFKTISVEHILPQNPPSSSTWTKDFDDDQRKIWTHKAANLVLISKRKNSSLSNLDFEEKKKNYLKKRIDVFAGSKVFIVQTSTWTPDILKKRQEKIIEILIKN
jgi:hypothetical protein